MEKKVKSVHAAPEMHWVGDGFPVQSVFSYTNHGRELSPFLLLDYAAPREFPPASQPRGVGAHPHRGFETVTIVYQGELEHKDSGGGGGKIGAGDVQWMTAASGIIHEEFHSKEFTENGGVFEVVQLWVNLPAKDKSAAPGYQTLTAGSIPSVDIGQNSVVRVIAGEYGGAKGPAKTFTPLNLLDVRLSNKSNHTFTFQEGFSTAVFVLQGGLLLNSRAVGAEELAIMERQGETVEVTATADSVFLILNGEPINEPVVGYGPFVMNNRAEIQQAYEDYQAGRFMQPDS